MTTYTVDSTGGASYTSPQLALVRVLADGGSGHVIEAVRDGDSFANQVLNASTTTGLTIRGANGVRWTLGLDPAGTSLLPGAGTVIEGKYALTITSGTNYACSIGATRSLAFSGLEWKVAQTGGGANIVMRMAATGSVVTGTSFLVSPLSGTPSYLAFCYVYQAAGTPATVTFENAAIVGTQSVAYGLVYYQLGGATVALRNCAHISSVLPLVYVRAGATLPSLSVRACHSPELVRNGGTITAYSGSYNVYTTTAVGTTSSSDKVSTVADMLLGGSRGITPMPGSPLLTLLPGGATVGTCDSDVDGNPRWRGGRMAVGPVQPQYIPTPLAVTVASAWPYWIRGHYAA